MKKIYLVQTVDFIDGYWGYAYKPQKAFTTKEAAEQYLSSLEELEGWKAKEGKVVEVKLEEGDDA